MPLHDQRQRWRDLVPNVKIRVYAILSRLCRQKGSHFDETELFKLEQDTSLFTNNWEGLFYLVLQKNWTKQQIMAYKEGKAPIYNYLAKWRMLYFQSKIDDANCTTHTVETMDGQKEKHPFATVRGMSFDAMKAYFYDMKEIKSLKGKMN